MNLAQPSTLRRWRRRLTSAVGWVVGGSAFLIAGAIVLLRASTPWAKARPDLAQHEWVDPLIRCLAGFNALARLTTGSGNPVVTHLMAEEAQLLIARHRFTEAVAIRSAIGRRCRSHYEPDDPRILDALRQDITLGRMMVDGGLIRDAAGLFESTCEQFSAIEGPDGPDSVMAEWWEAECLHLLENYPESTRHYEHVVGIKREALGAEHPDLIRLEGRLADDLTHLDRHREASTLREEILGKLEKTRGPEDDETIAARVNLAWSYWRLGENEKALALRQSLLAFYEMTLGADSPTALVAMNWVGVCLKSVGQLEQSSATLRRAYDGLEQIQGPIHKSTLSAEFHLAEVLVKLDRRVEARDLEQHTLDELIAGGGGGEGGGDPRVVETMARLAKIHAHLGENQEALALRESILNSHERTLGSDSPTTLLAMNWVGVCLKNVDELERAESTLRQAFDGLKRVQGPTHDSTLSAEFHLADVLVKLDRRTEARDLERHMLEDLLAGGGSDGEVEGGVADDPRIVKVMVRLANIHARLGENEEALALREAILHSYEKTFGSDSPTTLVAMNLVGVCLKNVGELERAESTLRQAFDGLERIHGPTHESTLSAEFHLADGLIKLDRRVEARDLERRTLGELTTAKGEDDPKTVKVMVRVAQIESSLAAAPAERLLRRRVYEMGLKTLDPDADASIANLIWLAASERSCQEFARAESLLTEALASREGSGQSDAVLFAYRNLVLTLIDLEAFDRAVSVARQVFDLVLASKEAVEPTRMVRTYQLLAKALIADRRLEAAQELLLEMATMDYRGMAHESSWIALGHASLQKAGGQLWEARATVELALREAIDLYGENSATTHSIMTTLRTILVEIGDIEAARSLTEEHLAIHDRHDVKDSLGSLGQRFQLAQLMKQQGEPSASKAHLRYVYDQRRAVCGDAAPTTLNAGRLLGEVLADLGEFEAASSIVAECLVAAVGEYGPDHPSVRRLRKVETTIQMARGDPSPGQNPSGEVSA